MTMRAVKRFEPSHCRECGAQINEISREQLGMDGPAGPPRLGCGHSAGEYTIVFEDGSTVNESGSMRVGLRRMRLALDNHASDLLLVGDRFEEGGQYVQREVTRSDSERWSWLEWDEAYDRLANEWRSRFKDAGTIDGE